MSSEFEVVFRQVLHRSPILLTPYSDPDTIDTDALGEFVKSSYAEAELEADDIATFAADMSEFLKTSELTETKAFVRSFVKEIEVKPDSLVKSHGRGYWK